MKQSHRCHGSGKQEHHSQERHTSGIWALEQERTGWTIRKVMEGVGQKQKKKIFPRKLLIKKCIPTDSGQKNICLRKKKNICTSHVQKKKILHLLKSLPLPHHFSNGPSLSKTLGSLYVSGKLPTYPSPKPPL